MARFRFRLEVSLRLAEQSLDEAQRNLAVESERCRLMQQERDLQAERWQEALKGQREAGSREPEQLGLWRAYAARMYEMLKVREQELSVQQERVEKARLLVVEAHRQVEKLKRLKERQAKAYELAELRREQKILDDIGHRGRFLSSDETATPL